jgi:hypothetical protein
MAEELDSLEGFKHRYDAVRNMFVLEVDAALLSDQSSETALVEKIVEILKNHPSIQGIEAESRK